MLAAAAGVGVLMTTLSLAACTPAPGSEIPHDAKSGGQTLSEMQKAVRSIPGLDIDADGGGRPNIKGNTGYAFDIKLDPAYEIVDGQALVEFLARSAWSVRDGYLPNATIDITVLSDKARPFDVRAAAEQSGWATHWAVTPDNGFSTVSIYTYADAEQGSETQVTQGKKNRARLGPWPGAVPSIPDGITAKIP
jgi:hypothetical protein